MSWLHRIRQATGIDSAIRELQSMQQRNMADKGCDDVDEVRQGRAVYSNIALQSTSGESTSPRIDDSSSEALTSTKETINRAIGAFKIAEGKDIMRLHYNVERKGLNDQSGNDNHLELVTNAKLRSPPKGPFGNAIYMPDVNSYARTLNNISFDLATQHALFSAWVYPIDIGDNNPSEASWGVINYEAAATFGLSLQRNNASVCNLRIWLNGNAALLGGNVPFNTWSHVAGIYTAASTTRTAFVNGASIGSDTTGSVISSNSKIALGKLVTYTTTPQGYISCAHLLIRPSTDPAFTATDVQNLYNTVMLGGGSIYDAPLCIGYGSVGA